MKLLFDEMLSDKLPGMLADIYPRIHSHLRRWA